MWFTHQNLITIMKNITCCQQSTEQLVLRYDECVLRGHSAYMCGLMAEASQYYQQAFNVSAKILSETQATEESIDRLASASLNCFDFCPCDKGDDDLMFLEIAETLLLKILKGKTTKNISLHALSAYADIAAIAQRYTFFCHSTKAEILTKSFTKFWDDHSRHLVVVQ